MSHKPNFTIKSLLEVGAHFGHKKNLWNPEMGKYIYGVKNKVHIIDLQQTAYHLYNTLQIIFGIASKNGRILFVNTKKQSTDVVKDAAVKCGQYYVNHRWLGGMLTNWSTVSSSIKTLKKYEEILESEDDKYTKKELLNFSRKKEKLQGLQDSNNKVRNISVFALKLYRLDVQKKVEFILKNNSNLKSKKSALILLKEYGKLDALKNILQALTLENEELKSFAWSLLNSWYEFYNVRLWILNDCDKNSYQEITALLDIINRSDIKIPFELLHTWSELQKILKTLKLKEFILKH